MAKLVTVAEMVAIEKAADAAGLSCAQMMENAGQGLAESIIAHSQEPEKSVLALVGGGNNGGDALVAAAILTKQGWKVSAYLLVERDGDPYLDKLQEAGGKLFQHDPEASGESLSRLIEEHAILVDGLLGTGIKLPLRVSLSQPLSLIKETLMQMDEPPFVIAVDCPSGMDCDSGEVAEETLPADLTVCMAAIKSGMLSLPAFESLGAVEVVDIGLPDDLPEWAGVTRFVADEEWVASLQPRRPLDAHKGTFGTALILAGSRQYPGAALLAGRAAARSGVGLVAMVVPVSVERTIAGHFPEAIWLPLKVSKEWFAADDLELLSPHLSGKDALLIGPGFGLNKSTAAFIEGLLVKKDLPPLVIDADGLKLLAGLDNWPKRLPKGTILTPHPGEMAILTGLSKEDIQSDRIEIAERFAAKWKQVVLLKGAFSVIAAPDGRTALLPIATPALATAGTGDVLAGLITGLRAQDLSAFDAAVEGASLHGMAGLNAAEAFGGTASVLASDLLAEIPYLFKE